MKVLMFGWEFPPISSGGLGTACYGLTKGLSSKGIEVTFVLPKGYAGLDPGHLNIISTDGIKLDHVNFKTVDSALQGYITSSAYKNRIRKFLSKGKGDAAHAIYGHDLYQEVERYAEKARMIAQNESFDIIHAHDWMTYKAGMNVKQETGKPLVVHVHATEFDRTGGNPNQHVYDIERQGMHYADLIIAVSNFTKDKIVQHYAVSAEKVRVLHNAVDFGGMNELVSSSMPNNHTNRFNAGLKNAGLQPMEKTVLFLGRLTLQKGPDYFLYAAKKVLETDSRVKFIIAGSGDMEPFIIHKAAELGISRNVLFTGFLSGSDVDEAYKKADLYVMPSVSEPFGITPLEAMKNGVPVLISKQSGVSEVLSNCLKTDFWDIDDMASKMMAVLNYRTLHGALRENGNAEVKKFSWENTASNCIKIYNEAIGLQTPRL